MIETSISTLLGSIKDIYHVKTSDNLSTTLKWFFWSRRENSNFFLFVCLYFEGKERTKN